MKASNTTITSHGHKSSVSPIRLKDDLINIETIKKQMRQKQLNLKNSNKVNSKSKYDLKSERQLSDPKKLLDEFLLPHATVMAYSKKKKNEYTSVHWKRAAKAAAVRRQREMMKKKAKSKPKLLYLNQ